MMPIYPRRGGQKGDPFYWAPFPKWQREFDRRMRRKVWLFWGFCVALVLGIAVLVLR